LSQNKNSLLIPIQATNLASNNCLDFLLELKPALGIANSVSFVRVTPDWLTLSTGSYRAKGGVAKARLLMQW